MSEPEQDVQPIPVAEQKAAGVENTVTVAEQKADSEEAERLRQELEDLRNPPEAKGLSEVEQLRAELEALKADKRAEQARAGRAKRGDADGVSAPLEPGETRENTHLAYLANGKAVEVSGNGGTHYGDENGVFPILMTTPIQGR